MLDANAPTLKQGLPLRGIVFAHDHDAMGDAMLRGNTELAMAPMVWSEAGQRVRRRAKTLDTATGVRLKGRRVPLNPESNLFDISERLYTTFFKKDPEQDAFITDLALGLSYIAAGVEGSIGGGIGVRLESLPSNFNPFKHADRGQCTGTIVISGTPMQAELMNRHTGSWDLYSLPEDMVQMWPGNHNCLGQRPLRHVHGDQWPGFDNRLILNALREP